MDVVHATAPTYDSTLSVFLGNLSFKSTEEEIREFFKDCGEIHSVRLVRDGNTGIGKGFGYVNFVSKDGVVLALQKNGQSINGREVRIDVHKYKKVASTTPKKLTERSQKYAKNKKGSIVKQPTDFSGEKSNKSKFVKKSPKNKLKIQNSKKQKKRISEILSK